ncbi:BrnT family toxin [candidate division CSSED10-310 bacterium]|uniref:BrnT family toxin n=1 Tax=candidate division CSSED10-310 bacterium TaxID=2855610 RepID=A0ABV6Z2F4_UNCC1
MEFYWDEIKRKKNLNKHGLDFEDAAKVFEGFTVTAEDSRFDYGEQRYVSLGLLLERVVVIIHTEEKEKIKIISMRKATKNEQKIYFTKIVH